MKIEYEKELQALEVSNKQCALRFMWHLSDWIMFRKQILLMQFEFIHSRYELPKRYYSLGYVFCDVIVYVYRRRSNSKNFSHSVIGDKQ